MSVFKKKSEFLAGEKDFNFASVFVVTLSLDNIASYFVL